MGEEIRVGNQWSLVAACAGLTRVGAPCRACRIKGRVVLTEGVADSRFCLIKRPVGPGGAVKGRGGTLTSERLRVPALGGGRPLAARTPRGGFKWGPGWS